MEQTPMQKLVKHIKTDVTLGMFDSNSAERIVWYIETYFIEKEKQAILSAYDCGKEQPSSSQQCPIDYYNSTFID